MGEWAGGGAPAVLATSCLSPPRPEARHEWRDPADDPCPGHVGLWLQDSQQGSCLAKPSQLGQLGQPILMSKASGIVVSRSGGHCCYTAVEELCSWVWNFGRMPCFLPKFSSTCISGPISIFQCLQCIIHSRVFGRPHIADNFIVLL